MSPNDLETNYLKFQKLRIFCESKKFQGYDPYDGLNTPFSKVFPLRNFNLMRLIWIQLFKKLPINLRPLFKIKEAYNPKGIALFLTGYCNLYQLKKKEEYLKNINMLADILIQLQTKGFSGACWGYNFPWQTRTGLFPKGFPTVVTTAFAACALMDAYDITKKNEYLDVALSSSNFILKDLKRTNYSEGFMFSYTPMKQDSVYNASLLGSRLLSRAYKYKKSNQLIENAKASVSACVEKQKLNGAWAYGELKFQNWIDSFHTGYNLESIHSYIKHSGDTKFTNALEKGFKFYIDNFFLADGTPKYFHNKIYPIDIHSSAQFIVTVNKLNKRSQNQIIYDEVFNWIYQHMQSHITGAFYYQKNTKYINKIPYMRWTQAWMFYASSYYFYSQKESD